MTRTIRNMIRRALETAIDSDTHLIDCMGGDKKTESDVAAYRRILARYFGSPTTRTEDSMKGLKRISIKDIIAGREGQTDLDATKEHSP